MQILSLNISNIISINSAKIQFEDTGLVLIEGWNYDADRSNGAGKTAIANAIAFALYGKIPRDVTASEILRKGAKAGFAEVDVLIGNDVYSVKRGRPASLAFKKNGQAIDIAQQEFENLIRLSYDQFLVSMYTAQDTSSKFIHLNDSEKKDFLLKLMNVDEFKNCKKVLDGEIDGVTTNINSINIKILNNNSKIEAYKEQVPDLAALNAKLDKTQKEIIDLTSELNALKLVKLPNLSDLENTESKLLIEQGIIQDARSSRSTLMVQARNLEKQHIALHGDTHHCPSCKIELSIVNGEICKADDVESLNDEDDRLKRDKDTVLGNIKKLDAKISKEKDINDLLYKIRSTKMSKLQESNLASERISGIRRQIKSSEELLGSIRANIASHDDLLSKIDRLYTDNEKFTLNIMKLSESLIVSKLASELFSPTGAPAYILDSAIALFNESIETYINMIWPNASYKLLSYKENKDGSVVAKLSEELIINAQKRSIGSLSGGERRALSISIDLAVIDTLSKQFGIHMNPIILDEPFDGLDNQGREVVVDLLSRLATSHQVFVIDHMSESNASFTKTLRIEKKNGISNIVSML